MIISSHIYTMTIVSSMIISHIYTMTIVNLTRENSVVL